MSDSLVWMCVKNGNSFMRKQGCTPKRGGVTTFSAEPSNLTSQHSFKYSGIANSKAIKFTVVEGETAGKKDVKIVMALKVAKNGSKPSKGFASTPLRFKSYMGAEKCIASQVRSAGEPGTDGEFRV